jgi:hypothetical protein
MANGIFSSYTAEEINADPSVLNGRTIHGSSVRDGRLYGLRLENVTLTNTTLHSITFYNFSMKNVVFANCSFIKCDFSGKHPERSDLENVTFQGGVMANSGDYRGYSNITLWENVDLHPHIEITGSAPQFGDLKVYNLTTPQGSPFNSAVQLTVTESRQPFAWPEVHVPTLEEMGIEPD